MELLDLKNLGDRLKESIKEEKTNQKDLAAEIGLSTTSMNNYVGGKRVPDADDFFKICSRLNISMEWALTGQGPKKPGEEFKLSDDEKEILEAYSKLSYEEKIIIKGKIFELLTSK